MNSSIELATLLDDELFALQKRVNDELSKRFPVTCIYTHSFPRTATVNMDSDNEEIIKPMRVILDRDDILSAPCTLTPLPESHMPNCYYLTINNFQEGVLQAFIFTLENGDFCYQPTPYRDQEEYILLKDFAKQNNIDWLECN